MNFQTRRNRLAIVRMTVLLMEKESLERKISTLIMKNYADWEIRDELNITKKILSESMERIKQMLLEAGVKEKKDA